MKCICAQCIVVAVLVGCAACSPNARRPQHVNLAAGPGPQFLLLDSLVLEENDTLYLGKPEMGFVVDDSGDIYVADEFWNRLIRFRPDGRIDRVFGRAGSGPGEFRSTTPATIVFDTLVIQGSAGRLKVFNRNTGQFYFERAFGRGVLGEGRRQGDRLVLALFDFASGRGVLSWPLTEFLGHNLEPTANPPSSNMVQMPPEYTDYPGLRDFGSTAIALWADTMMVGFDGVDYLVVYRADGTPVDTIDIPARIRHGITAATLAAFGKGKQPTLEQDVNAFAQFVNLWRLPNGETLLLYRQDRVIMTGTHPKFFGDAFLTLLASDRRTACVDTSIPFPGAESPRISVHGDTLLALDQIASGRDSLRSVSVIRKYQVSDDHCKWVPIKQRH
jgi:hypothetical protein